MNLLARLYRAFPYRSRCIGRHTLPCRIVSNLTGCGKCDKGGSPFWNRA